MSAVGYEIGASPKLYHFQQNMAIAWNHEIDDVSITHASSRCSLDVILLLRIKAEPGRFKLERRAAE